MFGVALVMGAGVVAPAVAVPRTVPGRGVPVGVPAPPPVPAVGTVHCP